MEDLTDLFVHYIKNSPSLDMAEAEFRHSMIDDPELRREYRQYCRDNGYTEKNGFKDFCEEYMQEEDSMWNTLSDFDNQE